MYTIYFYLSIPYSLQLLLDQASSLPSFMSAFHNTLRPVTSVCEYICVEMASEPYHRLLPRRKWVLLSLHPTPATITQLEMGALRFLSPPSILECWLAWSCVGQQSQLLQVCKYNGPVFLRTLHNSLPETLAARCFPPPLPQHSFRHVEQWVAYMSHLGPCTPQLEDRIVKDSRGHGKYQWTKEQKKMKKIHIGHQTNKTVG